VTLTSPGVISNTGIGLCAPHLDLPRPTGRVLCGETLATKPGAAAEDGGQRG